MSKYKYRLKVSRRVKPLFLLLRTRAVFHFSFLLVFNFGVCGGYHEQKFAMEPQDQVGAAISMTYITGQPIVFVGTGQTYTDLKALNANAVVHALMK